MDELAKLALSRRRLFQTAAIAGAGIGVWQLGAQLPALANSVSGSAASPGRAAVDPATAATLEAFADTIVPGEKRFPGDVAVAGAAPGPSAAATGALDVLAMPEVGLAAVLPGLAMMLNGQAAGYGLAVGLTLDPNLPPFVALPFAHRTNLVTQLVTPGRPDHGYWAVLASLCTWSFDSAAAQHTAAAVGTGHPGLAWNKFPAPNADGVWRFPKFSYRRAVADLSPMTTRSGSPA